MIVKYVQIYLPIQFGGPSSTTMHVEKLRKEITNEISPGLATQVIDNTQYFVSVSHLNKLDNGNSVEMNTMHKWLSIYSPG